MQLRREDPGLNVMGRLVQPVTLEDETHLVFVIDDVVGQTGVDLLEGDTPFEAGERRTQAEVGAIAEAKVPVGVRVTSKTSADSPNSRSSWFAAPMSNSTESPGPHRLTVTLNVGGQGAVHVLRRVVERSTSSTAVAAVRARRRAVPADRDGGKKFDGVRDHLGRGFVPGDHEQHTEAQQFLLVELSAVDLGIEEVGDQAGAITGTAGLEVLHEIAEQFEHPVHRFFGDLHRSVLADEDLVGRHPQGVAIVLGDPRTALMTSIGNGPLMSLTRSQLPASMTWSM